MGMRQAGNSEFIEVSACFTGCRGFRLWFLHYPLQRSGRVSSRSHCILNFHQLSSSNMSEHSCHLLCWGFRWGFGWCKWQFHSANESIVNESFLGSSVEETCWQGAIWAWFGANAWSLQPRFQRPPAVVEHLTSTRFGSLVRGIGVGLCRVLYFEKETLRRERGLVVAFQKFGSAQRKIASSWSIQRHPTVQVSHAGMAWTSSLTWTTAWGFAATNTNEIQWIW